MYIKSFTQICNGNLVEILVEVKSVHYTCVMHMGGGIFYLAFGVCQVGIVNDFL